MQNKFMAHVHNLWQKSVSPFIAALQIIISLLHLFMLCTFVCLPTITGAMILCSGSASLF